MKHKYSFAALAAFAFMFALPAWALPRPTSATFAKGAKFTVEGYAADKPALTGFPVLVRIAKNSPLGFSYNDLMSKTTGADIAFVDMNGNGLPFEIDTWNTNGTSLVWVSLPTMTNGTQFVMCWGSATSGKTVCGDNPFAGYYGVWHMNEANAKDSSANHLDGMADASVTIVDAKLGTGANFPSGASSSTGMIRTTNTLNSAFSSAISFETWARPSEVTGEFALFGKEALATFKIKDSTTWFTTPGKKDFDKVNYSVSVDTWYHIVLTFIPNKTAKVYVNGILVKEQNDDKGGFNKLNESYPVVFGSNQWNQYYNGILDECRLLTTELSADWIAASYATQNDAEFLTAGMAMPYDASAEPVVSISAPSSGLGYTNATLTVSVGSLGMDAGKTTDADWVDLLVVVSPNPDLSSPIHSVSLSRVTSAPVSPSAEIVPLALTTTYYAQVFATNSFGVAGESSVVSFTTPVPGPVFTASVNTDHIAPDISLSLTSQGLGLAVTQITVQVSSSGDFTSPDLTKTLLVDFADMPVALDDIVLTGLPVASPLHYRFIAENSDGYATTVDVEAVNPVGAGDNVWSGLSEDINDPNAYVFAGGLPLPGKTLYFTKPAGLSPVINRDVTMPSLRFWNGKTKDNNGNEVIDTAYLNGYHSCGYNFSGSGVLTFTAEKPIVQVSYGTNTISNPILFSPSDSQSVTIMSVGEDKAWLNLNGSLHLPDGVANTTMKVTGRGNTVLGGASPDFMDQLSVEGGRLTFANPCAMTNVSKLYFSGDPTSISNAIGAPLVFPRVSSIKMDNGWPGRKLHEYGAPFVFPQATFEWGIRDYNQSTFEADWVVSNVVVRMHGSNSIAVGDKTGHGAFIVKGETTWYVSSVKSYIKITSGCFFPATAAGLPPSGEIYLPGNNSSYGTLGLSGDYNPMLNGSSSPRLFQSNSQARWGFTGFGGDRTVCWDGDSSFNLTNTSSYKVETKLTNTTDTNTEGKTYDQYYAYPACFMFGNRSEYADGTIIFMNPIRYEFGQNWDTLTCFESTNHVVAARMRGSLKLGNSGKKWNFSGRNFGGYLALEAENTDFTGKVNIFEKGNLLVNSNLVARSVTVQSGAGLGGFGDLETEDGTTVKSGGSLFGGEWNKGGTLTIGGKLTFERGSSLRVEAGASDDCRGCVKLAAGSTLNLTAPVYVDVDTDPRVSPVRGASRKVLDWSEVSSFGSGAAPTRENFVVRPERNADLKKISVSVRDDGLYVGYATVRCPMQMIIIVR